MKSTHTEEEIEYFVKEAFGIGVLVGCILTIIIICFILLIVNL